MNHKKTTNAINAPSCLLEQIAREHLFVQTLQTQNSDRLDFHDVSVWGIEAALQAAYQAGLQAQTKKQQGKTKRFRNRLISERNEAFITSPIF